MRWVIESIADRTRVSPREFNTMWEAEHMRRRIAYGMLNEFCVVPSKSSDLPANLIKMLREGMVRGDLQGILLPKLSIDQYIPSDPKTDNIVLAFFIKGVPEAVLPLKNYIDHCEGIVDVDYGDSETIPNCSIVYAEMNRDKLNTENIHTIIKQMARLASIEPTDFTLTFPTSDDKFPYDPAVLDQYFEQRTAEDNQQAQEQAVMDQHQKEVESNPEQNQIASEALINKMVGLFG